MANAVAIVGLLAISGSCAAADYGKLATLIFSVVAVLAIAWCCLTALIFRLLNGQGFWKRIGLSLLFLILPVAALSARLGWELVVEKMRF